MGESLKKKPSEIISDFLDLVELSIEEYEDSKKQYEQLDSETLKWAHRFEFAKDKSERNKLGTAYQKERRARRDAKDHAELYETVYTFSHSENNKPTLKRLKGALERQKEKERYLFGKREYKEEGERVESDTD